MLPLLDRFHPEALIIQGGADALVEDPMSRLCLSNQVIFKILSILLGFSQRVLPNQATELLRSLSWQRQTKPKEIMLNSIYDVPMEGQLRDEVRDIVKKVSSFHKFKHS